MHQKFLKDTRTAINFDIPRKLRRYVMDYRQDMEIRDPSEVLAVL